MINASMGLWGIWPSFFGELRLDVNCHYNAIYQFIIYTNGLVDG